MSLEIRLDSVEHVQFILACDPAVVEINGPLELALYHVDGDSSRLEIPEDAARVTVRPYTDADIRAASRAAGRLPHRGHRVNERKAEAKVLKDAKAQVAKAQTARAEILAKLTEARGDGDEDARPQDAETLTAELESAAAKIAEERERLADTDAEWMEALSDGDAEAFRSYYLYKNDEMEALVERCLVGYRAAAGAPEHPVFVEHGAAGLLRALGDMRSTVIAEIWTRLNLLSRLGDEGKARLERAFGSDQPSDSTAATTGTAVPALPAPASTPSAGTAKAP